MKRFIQLSTLLCLLGVIGWKIGQHHDTAATSIVEFSVGKGTLSDVLREVGELAPQDPLLLQAPFTGEIKWLVEDGSWVKQGEHVLVFDEEALEQQVSTLRANVVDREQQLRIAGLQADHARIAEQQRVENSRNDLKLAEIRHRILLSKPVGGDRLVELDQEIRPVEARLEKLQAGLEPLEKRFRTSREVYQAALQKWQAGRSRVLEIQMSADLLKARAGAGPAADPKGGNKRIAKVQPVADQAPKPDGEKEPPLGLEEAQAEAAALKEALDLARSDRDRDHAPYAELVAAIDAVDAEAQERYILIEIEKRGLPATRLVIDCEIARLRLADSQRLAESGKRALEVGAMSKSRYDLLVANAEASAGRLEILEYRLEIASRPATEDRVATSEASLASARRAVDNAQEIFDREMDILSSAMAVTEAKLAEALGEMERNGKGFPAAIEANITMLRAEQDVLAEDDTARRAEILAELARLEAELGRAVEHPPHIVLAPSDGLVRLRTRGERGDDRLTDIGDRWEKGHTVAMLYPPGNMRVQVGINEVNYQRVREGMACAVRIPALDMEISDATVVHMSRIGRDRVETQGHWVNSQHSGIIEFSLSVDLRREVAEFRQGMTVLLEIETDVRENALFLPAAAVQEDTAGYSVLLDPKSGRQASVQGAYFGDDRFILSGGLKQGDRVYRSYAKGPGR
jgi:multidrug resistance efflux pump